MDVSFIRDRITQLRIQKGISEYKMSLDLGHSKAIFKVSLPENHCPPFQNFYTSVIIWKSNPTNFLTQATTNPCYPMN